MWRKLLSVGALILLAASPTSALVRGGRSPPPAITIINYAPTGTTTQDQISKLDVNGNHIDATAGDILQVGATFYWIGDSAACGFMAFVGGPYCGENIYSSTDLVNWTFVGQPFDITTGNWAAQCAGVGTGAFTGGYGCYTPRWVYNAAHHNYVLWIYAENTAPYLVMTSATPTSGYGTPTTPTCAALSSTTNHDLALFVDPGTGTGYAIYGDPDFRIMVVQLNSTYTDCVGSETMINAVGSHEAVSMFKQGSTYFATYGSTCPYCTGGATPEYATASSPLGTWTPQGAFASSACNAQPGLVNQLTTPSGSTFYLYTADQWFGGPNEGFSNHFWDTLTFGSGTINTMNCDATVTINGLTPAPPATTWNTGADTASTAAQVYWDPCGLEPYPGGTFGGYVSMTFKPTTSHTISHLVLDMAKNNINGSCSGYPWTGCIGAPTTDVKVQIATGTPIGSSPVTVTVPNASISWTPKKTVVPISYAVTAGTTYTINIYGSASSVTPGCFATPLQKTGSYANGGAYLSVNNGVSFSQTPIFGVTMSNATMAFAEY